DHGKFDATYKTTMCRKIMSKEPCEYGSKCRFAHSEGELRRHPNNGAHHPYPSHPPHHNSLAFKTVLCSNYTESGQCKYGNNSAPLTSAPSNGGGNNMATSLPALSTKFSGNSVLYKTTMCANIRNKIPCPHGPSCLFAHSSAELRSPMQNISVNTYSPGNKPPPPPLCAQSLRVYGGGYSCYSLENGGSLPPLGNNPRTYGIPHHQQLSGAAASAPNGGAKKTAMCRHIQFNGICPRGNQCTFAHTPEELVVLGGKPEGPEDKEDNNNMYFKRKNEFMHETATYPIY
ncbi:Uncharacterized protein FKW44_017828, partial [Caligus rogercresseyi]